MIVNPTIACADLLNLKRDIDILADEGIGIIHIDIMDGHYVPNLCFSFDAVEQISANYPNIRLDIHIMSDLTVQFCERLVKIRPHCISFHPSTVRDPGSLIRYLHENGIKAGIAIEPDESAEKYSDLYASADLVLIMCVKPGFSGQSLIPSAYGTISRVNSLRKSNGFDFLIEVDGGISRENVSRCAVNGADIAVAGAMAIFNQTSDLGTCCAEMKRICDEFYDENVIMQGVTKIDRQNKN